MISFINQITVAQSKNSSSLSTQPVCTHVQVLQQLFKISSYFIYTGLKFHTPFIISSSHNAL